jgi:hypothetical protein
MERVDPMPGRCTGEDLCCLFNDLSAERNQAIEFTARFLEAPAVEAVRCSAGLPDHMAGHLFEFSDRFLPAFRRGFAFQ